MQVGSETSILGKDEQISNIAHANAITALKIKTSSFLKIRENSNQRIVW